MLLDSRGAAQIAPERRASHAFTLTLEASISMVNGLQQKVSALTEVDYTWSHRAATRTLSLDRVLMKTTQDAKVEMHAQMSRQALTRYNNGQPMIIPTEKALPEVKAMLEESFGKPLYRLGPDGTSTILATGAGKEMVDEAMIGQTSLFHPMLPPDKSDWETSAAMILGSEGVVRGKLRYRRIPNRPGAVYSVQGTLTNDRYPIPGGKTVMSGVRYVVNGEQTLDEATYLWLAGKLNIEITYSIAFLNGQKAGDAKGTAVATMRRLGK